MAPKALAHKVAEERCPVWGGSGQSKLLRKSTGLEVTGGAGFLAVGE